MPRISDHGPAPAKYTLPAMQKLFSMFPRGAPGVALLLLRLFAGAQLAADAVVALAEPNLFLAVRARRHARSQSSSGSRRR